MKTQIPIYRAKRKDNGEYVEGTGTTDFLNINRHEYPQYAGEGRTWLWNDYSWVEIDPETLAIHFPDMKDKNDKPIFASLSEDGKGGTEVTAQVYGISKGKTWILHAYWRDSTIWFNKIKTSGNERQVSLPIQDALRDMKVTGIYEGADNE